MSGINRFLSRREKRASGSQQKKVKLPTPSSSSSSSSSSSQPSMPTTKSSLPSSPLSGTSTSDSFHSSSSLCSLSLAFQTPLGKCCPRSRITQDYVQSTTANSDGMVLQPRMISSDDPYGVFTLEESTKPAKDEEKKIKALQARLSKIGITKIKEAQIEYALLAKYSDGDQEKAYDFLVLIEDSVEGIIREYSPDVRLLGAINREKVTCWLDALLFAMFARLRSFEVILQDSFTDQPRRRLATLLRLWVNMLRTGKLITTDITKHVQDALAACGWEDAAAVHQHDVSEAFTFIAEQLELPRLTLKMDIYHTGKEDATDDHKLINERLLQVGIPNESTDGRVITLEDCLENYFNNRIEVRRHLERKGTMTSFRSMDSMKAQAFQTEIVEAGTSLSPQSHVQSPLAAVPDTLDMTGSADRSPSIIRDRVVAMEVEPTHGDQSGSTESGRRTGRRRSTIRKEVLMPAWQFFSLLPWYTDRAPANDAQVATQFSTERPVLGLCLKRYSMLPNGRAIRLNTYVDIPLEIGLPHFIRDDDAEDDGPQLGNFKLSLQSAVCHRGVSVDEGHYISLVRSRASDSTTANGHISSHGQTNRPQEAGDDRWMRFDDLARDRVTYVDIEKALKEESPYLLFYQVQPVHEPLPRVTADPPPPYTETNAGHPSLKRERTKSVTSSTSAGNNHEPAYGRTSVDFPLNNETHSRRPSTSSGRPRSATYNHVHIVAGPTPSRQSSDGSRQGNGVVNEQKGPLTTTTKTQPEEGRLSATFSKLAARMSRDRLRTGYGSASASVSASESTQATSDATMMDDAAGNGPTNGQLKLKAKRRGKSPAIITRTNNHKSPERECGIM
ncbi:MAG: hypothetical protein M1816_003249 [Peltula sp. TS41687]|nr:MAG: hypothetical protein M1816_003249 [Peltula sp. TS41687]